MRVRVGLMPGRIIGYTGDGVGETVANVGSGDDVRVGDIKMAVGGTLIGNNGV